MLTRIGRATRTWLDTTTPWTNVYGLARTLIAGSTALTFALNRADILFRPVAGSVVEAPICAEAMQKATLYCALGHAHLEWARWIAVLLLIVVASGWRPRVTGLVHWWLALGLQITGSTLEGGDQAAAVLTLLMLPICLTDRRRWHWSAPDPRDKERDREWARMLAGFGHVAVRVQVAAIYFHAAIGKLKVKEWEEGTAVYYWFTHPLFGAAHWLAPILRPVITSAVGVSAITWGTIVLETFLAAGLIATRGAKRWLLLGGLALHSGIWLIHGLASFAIVLFGALILYLRPLEEPFAWPGPVERAWRGWRGWEERRRLSGPRGFAPEGRLGADF